MKKRLLTGVWMSDLRPEKHFEKALMHKSIDSIPLAKEKMLKNTLQTQAPVGQVD